MLRKIVELSREEILELLSTITQNKLVKITNVVKDITEDSLHVSFKHMFGEDVLHDYLLLHPMGFYGSALATYRYVVLENGDCMSIERIARRFYQAKNISEKETYPFTPYVKGA